MLFRIISVMILIVGFHNACNADIDIRMLILKHAREQMANDDADLAIRAVQSAAAKGLSIKTIGNHHIDRDGKIRVSYVDFNDVEGFKRFVIEQMKIDARAGDTVVVFTIGHGHPSGDLQNLGQRTSIMNALAYAAEVNNQETVWWQLSCHAAARLPTISSLPKPQQSLFSIVASSTATQLSPAYVEGKHMEKVFVAMAERSDIIDPDKNGIITAKEMAYFINEVIGERRGDLVFAISPDEPIFGGSAMANKFPIVDKNNPQKTYPPDYIPLPGRW